MSRLTRRAALAALAALAAAPLAPAAARAAGAKRIVFGQSTDGFLYVPLYIARAKDYLGAEGIDAEVIVTGGGAKALAAVIGGSAQVYVGTAASGAKALSKGQPIVSFAALMTEYGSNLVMQGTVAKERNVTAASQTARKIEALKGLKVGITSPGSATDQLLRYMIERQKLDPTRDVTIVPVGGSGPMLAAFAQKRIDAFLLSSPTGETAVTQHGGVMLINFSRGEFEPVSGMLYISLMARKDWLEQNAQAATGIARAMWKAERLLTERPDEAKAAVRRFFEKTEPAVFDQAWESNLEAYPASPVIAPAAMQKAIDFMNATEDEKADVTAQQAVDNRYAEQAVRS